LASPVPPALLTSADEVHALMSTLWGKADIDFASQDVR
jgi:hypothetical protein